MAGLLEIAVAVGATQIASDPLKALVTGGAKWSVAKVRDAVSAAKKVRGTGEAIARAEASLQTRTASEVRTLLNDLDPSRLTSVYEAVCNLPGDLEGGDLRRALKESFQWAFPTDTALALIEAAVEAFYVALLEALRLSDSPLKTHAELLHDNWQHERTRRVLGGRAADERAESTIQKVREALEDGKTVKADALLCELESAGGRGGPIMAEVLTLRAGLLERQGLASDAVRKLQEASNLAPHHPATRINLVRARELLGKTDDAHRLAGELREKYPESLECYVAYIRTTSAENWRSELKNVPDQFSLNWKVSAIFARHALVERDAEKAVELARQALELNKAHPEPWYLLGRAISVIYAIDSRQQHGRTSMHELLTEGLRAAESCFQRLEVRDESGPAQATALALSSEMLLALGRRAESDAAAERAYFLDSKEPEVRFHYARVLDGRGAFGAAVEILDADPRNLDTDFVLAQLLLKTGSSSDLNRVKSLLLPIARDRTLSCQSDVVGLLFTAIGRQVADKSELADTLAEELAEACDPRWLLVLRASAKLRCGEKAEAAKLVAGAMTDSDGLPWSYLRLLATTLTGLEQWAEALPHWQSLFSATGDVADARDLTHVALRTGHHGVALEILGQLREKLPPDNELLHLELNLLERYNPDKAVAILQEYLECEPTDRTARLRLSVLGMRLQRDELVDLQQESLPAAHEATPQQCRAAVHMLRHSGKPARAIEYAYQVIRRHFGQKEAHDAYRDSVLLLRGDGDVLLGAPSTVQLGSAVRYRLDNGEKQWVVLEQHDEPLPALDEIGPDSSLCQRLVGVSVEEPFVLRKQLGIRVEAVVVELKSKYLYRFHDVMARSGERFPDANDFVSVPIKEKENGELDVEHLLLIFGRGQSMLPEIETEFRAKPLPVNIFTLVRGGDRYGAHLHLLNHDSLGPRCCVGTREERQRGEQVIAGAQGIVVCATALITIFLSETWSLLDVKTELFVTPGTLDLLRANSNRGVSLLGPTNILLAGPKWSRTATGLASKLGDFLDVVESRTTVAGAEPLACLPPERREQLTKYFGNDCAEAIAVAAALECPLWTDDFAAGVLAEGEFGVPRVWTQLVAAFNRRPRAQDDLVTRLTASLLGWRYAFTASDRMAWRAAGTLAAWNPREWPLRGAVGTVSSPEMPDDGAIAAAAELIGTGVVALAFPAAREELVSMVVGALGARAGGFTLVRRLLAVLHSGQILSIPGIEEAKETVQIWLAKTLQAVMTPN